MRVVSVLKFGLLVAALAAWVGTGDAFAQDKKSDKAPPPPSIDAATGKVLSEAIELLNAEKYADANAKISTLVLEELSPFERGKVEQILISIAIAKEDYAGARKHIDAAIASGGMNEQEISQVRYQRAQLFIQEENWKEGAKGLEEWIATATSPNSAAYYLLAICYYQLESLDKALPPAKKAVELMDPAKPQEGWISLLVALHLQKNQFREAMPYLERLVALAPQKKGYWLQLVSVHQQIEDYPKALALMQIAYDAGLLTDDADVRRVADLQLFNGVPTRCGILLENAIEKKQIKVDQSAYEKLANCWIAAAEFEKAVTPLKRAGELAANGDLYVRLGEVQVHRENWSGAEEALRMAVDKGKLKDLSNAQLLMGISLFNQRKLSEAATWFNRLPKSDKYGKMAQDYIRLIADRIKQDELDRAEKKGG